MSQADTKQVVPYAKILIGYDGSENSKRALQRAISLTEQTRGKLRIVVAANATMGIAGRHDVLERLLEWGKTLLSDALSQAKQASIDVSGSVEDGSPAAMILSQAESANTDLIVVGRSGVSGVERFIIGSVSSSVVAHSRCDVLIVK
jgi:nucleotide-binding universal stress UspA family protein